MVEAVVGKKAMVPSRIKHDQPLAQAWGIKKVAGVRLLFLCPYFWPVVGDFTAPPRGVE
jgi:hypothetical protein